MSLSTRRNLALGVAYAICLWSLTLAGVSATNAEDRNQVELDALRDQIKALESRLAKDGKTRDKTAERLEELEKRVVEVRKRIKATGERQQQTESDIATLEVEKQALEKSLNGQRQRIGDLVRNLYQAGEKPQIRMLLSENSPARASRALVWYQYVAEARKDLIAEIDADLARSRQVNTKLQLHAQELSTMAAALLADESELANSAKEKKILLTRLDQRLDNNQGRATLLRENEQRLVTLIETINKARQEAQRRSEQIAREEAQKRAERKREAERKRALAEQQKREAELRQAEALQRQIEEEEARAKQELARQLAEKNAHKPFAELKGKLALPLQAEIIGRFGEQKPDSGVRWEGLMLASEAGREVKAISAGEVVYADWYRGYGQLLLIDHGDDYMSLYSHNSDIFKSIGDLVSAGETVALVGATGGLAEPGLYFEIRQASQARDPLIWCKVEK